ncbi:MAG: cytochrome c5 family protein [Gammaproteobacteria bacterium]|nr:cytochrome c5 family protein [Gammaproteobacteria bacterium]
MLTTSITTPADSKTTVDRITPVGKVNTGAPIIPEPAAAPEAVAAPETAAAAAAPEQSAAATPAAAKSGEDVYKSACFACHLTGAAGAPKFGDKAAWEPRIATGIDALMQTVLNGKGAMPPRGTCMTCSEDELKSAVEYMIAQVQ